MEPIVHNIEISIHNAEKEIANICLFRHTEDKKIWLHVDRSNQPIQFIPMEGNIHEYDYDEEKEIVLWKDYDESEIRLSIPQKRKRESNDFTSKELKNFYQFIKYIKGFNLIYSELKDQVKWYDNVEEEKKSKKTKKNSSLSSTISTTVSSSQQLNKKSPKKAKLEMKSSFNQIASPPLQKRLKLERLLEEDPIEEESEKDKKIEVKKDKGLNTSPNAHKFLIPFEIESPKHKMKNGNTFKGNDLDISSVFEDTPGSQFSDTKVYNPLSNRSESNAPRIVRTYASQSSQPESTGFINFANNCFVNATLQSLLNLRPFTDDLQKFVGLRKNEDKESDEFSKVIWGLRKDILQQRESIRNGLGRAPINPKRALETMANKVEAFQMFQGYSQQDSQEFLSFCLEEITLDSEKQFGKQEKDHDLHCPVRRNFHWEVEHVYKCANLKCQNVSKKIEILRIFPLTLSLKDGVTSLDSLIEEAFQSEEVQKDCEECNGKLATVTHSIKRLPRIFIFHLKRFQTNAQGFSSKNHKSVPLSLQLDLSSHLSDDLHYPEPFQYPLEKECSSKPPSEEEQMNWAMQLSLREEHPTHKPIYHLQSIVRHIGVLSSGHYISDVYHPVDDRWLRYNDKQVEKISNKRCTETEEQKNSYLLFYVHCDSWPKIVKN